MILSLKKNEYYVSNLEALLKNGVLIITYDDLLQLMMLINSKYFNVVCAVVKQ